MLIPLCVHQPTTQRAISLYASYEAAVWWGTPVEIASALSRLSRMRQVDTPTLNRARRLASEIAATWIVVEPRDPVREVAMDLVYRYQLRAADALQVAAALAWCSHRPHDRIFLSADERLREAALRAGFDAPRL